MRNIKSAVFLFVSFMLASAGSLALEKEAFTPERFEALQAANEVVLIDIYAAWCPTCARQQQVLTEYRANNPDKQFHILVVDFDDNKEWVRHFRAPRQSTLLLYAGETQFWFSVAETRAEIIAAELDKAFRAIQ